LSGTQSLFKFTLYDPCFIISLRCFYFSIQPRLSVAIVHDYFIRLKIVNLWLSCFHFSHSLFLALSFSTFLSLISLSSCILIPFFSLSFPIDFFSAKPVPTFHFVPQNILRIHSRVTRSYTTHETNAFLLTEKTYIYAHVREYTYTYTYIHTHARSNTRTHTHTQNTCI